MNSVLLSLHTYWGQVFLIPKGVLQTINKICITFLWEGKLFLHNPPHVAWSKVFMPKKNGGLLGVRDCISWNVAAIGKYV